MDSAADDTRVIVDFVGGSLDGARLDTDSDDASEVQRACRCFLETDGVPGARFRVASDASFEAMVRAAIDRLRDPAGPVAPVVLRVDHVYEVDACEIDGLTIRIRARAVTEGTATGPSR